MNAPTAHHAVKASFHWQDPLLLDTQLTAEDEELTPTMKLKRSLVQTKYAGLIEPMYRTGA